jgi:uncharacterized membrane protein YkvA (DUF1232 family)
METSAQRRLDVFSQWLKALPSDVKALASILAQREPESVRVAVVSALVYLTRNLDLIPDGIEGIGYLDDAFVLRTASAIAVEAVGVGAPTAVRRLARDNDLVQDFLGPDYARFRTYVANLRDYVSKGRTSVQIAASDELSNAIVVEANEWCAEYRESPLKKDPAELERLQMFMRSKLSLVRG